MLFDKSIFKILGIENLELPVSNLFAYWFEKDTKFLEDFIKLVCSKQKNMSFNFDYNNYCIMREFTNNFTKDEDKKNKRQDRYDLLICSGKDFDKSKKASQHNIPDAFICIENKVHAKEGNQQTDRYEESLKDKLGEIKDRLFVYMHYENAYVKLSNENFIDLRYHELKEICEKHRNLPLMEDFIESFINKFDELKKFSLEPLPPEFDDDNMYKMDFFVDRFDENTDTLKIQCLKGENSKSKGILIHLTKQNWHIKSEIVNSNLKLQINEKLQIQLRYESDPYKTKEELGKLGKNKYDFIQKNIDKIKEEMKNFDSNDFKIKIKPLNQRNSWIISNFNRKSTENITYNEFFNKISRLVNDIDNYLSETLKKLN